MELLDIVNEQGIPTGEKAERSQIHRMGLLHRTSHVWLARKRKKQIQILLQKRSACKDSFPGCFDISSAGHIPAGQNFISSALRELKEELGVNASPKELILCGQRRICYQEQFHGQPFFENQISRIYLLWKDPPLFHLQTEEVEQVVWIDFETCQRGIQQHLFDHCISLEELNILSPFLK